MNLPKVKPLAPLALREQVRTILKENGGGRSRETNMVPVELINIRKEYNPRLKPEGMSAAKYEEEVLKIPEFAMEIYNDNGIKQPLEGDFTEDGKFWTNDGHRRRLATQWLMKQGLETFPNGEPVNMIEVFILHRSTTEEDRFFRTYSSQNNLQLNGVELAFHVARYKAMTEKSNDELAEKYHKSRQWIDNKITISEQPKEIINAILAGTVSETAVLDLNRKFPDEAARIAAVLQAQEGGKKIKVSEAKDREDEDDDEGGSGKSGGSKGGAPKPFKEAKTKIELDMNESIGQIDKAIVKLEKEFQQTNHTADVVDILEKASKRLQEARDEVKKLTNKKSDDDDL